MDLRSWLTAVEQEGDLRRVCGANADEEIGAINDIAMSRIGEPVLLFDEIPGFDKGRRVLSNVLTSPRRVARTLGLDPSIRGLELVKACRAMTASRLKRIPPRLVEDGPVTAHVIDAAAVDLTAFPAPRWHEEDGGGFIGTGSAVIERDPETGWVNVGTYRLTVHDRDRLGLMITPGHQGRVIMERYWARGEACPVAVSLGHHPLLLIVSGMTAPYGVSEYDLAGGIAGEPVDVVTGELTGLPIPAASELVVEGFVEPGDEEDEGPFGEWPGYYASIRKPAPVLRVKRIYHRDDPIVLGVVPGKPPSDNTYHGTFMWSAMVWNDLEAAGIPGVAGVWADPAGGGRMWVVVAIKQLYPGHAKQAGMVAAHSYAGGYMSHWVVVVDDDIDPTSLDEVIWALATRVDAREDVDVLSRTWSSPVDPVGWPFDAPMFATKTVIDACIPWERRATFPHVARNTPGLRARTLAKWGPKLDFLETTGDRRRG